tara:strand:+ start:7426 stop:7560 length:135 start_codon:yes stop_codon:yes gene_type:complete
MRSNEHMNGGYTFVAMTNPIPTPTLAKLIWTKRKVYLKTDQKID